MKIIMGMGQQGKYSNVAGAAVKTRCPFWDNLSIGTSREKELEMKVIRVGPGTRTGEH